MFSRASRTRPIQLLVLLVVSSFLLFTPPGLFAATDATVPAPTHHGSNLTPTVVGALSAVIVGAAIASAVKPGESTILKRDGPRMPRGEFSLNNFSVRWLAEAGWPVVVEYALPEPCQVTLEVQSGKRAPVVFALPGDPGLHAGVENDLPDQFGQSARPATFTLTSFRLEGNSRIAAPLDLSSMGIGPGAVTSEPEQRGALGALDYASRLGAAQAGERERSLLLSRVVKELALMQPVRESIPRSGGKNPLSDFNFLPRQAHARSQPAQYRFHSQNGYRGVYIDVYQTNGEGPTERNLLHPVRRWRWPNHLPPGGWVGNPDWEIWDCRDSHRHVSVGYHRLVVRVWNSPGDPHVSVGHEGAIIGISPDQVYVNPQ